MMTRAHYAALPQYPPFPQDTATTLRPTTRSAQRAKGATTEAVKPMKQTREGRQVPRPAAIQTTLPLPCATKRKRPASSSTNQQHMNGQEQLSPILTSDLADSRQQLRSAGVPLTAQGYTAPHILLPQVNGQLVTPVTATYEPMTSHQQIMPSSSTQQSMPSAPLSAAASIFDTMRSQPQAIPYQQQHCKPQGSAFLAAGGQALPPLVTKQAPSNHMMPNMNAVYPPSQNPYAHFSPIDNANMLRTPQHFPTADSRQLLGTQEAMWRVIARTGQPYKNPVNGTKVGRILHPKVPHKIRPSDGQPPYVPMEGQHPPWDDADGHYVFKINDDLTSRYKILALLGQGTFGKVVECFDRMTGEHVAIKIIKAVQKYREAAKIELRVLQTIQANDSPDNQSRCIHLKDAFDYRDHICMVFPLLSLSVFDFLRSNNFHPFSLRDIQSFAKQLLISVAYMHSLNLIHTDLKPENILLHSSKNYVEPKHPLPPTPLPDEPDLSNSSKKRKTTPSGQPSEEKNKKPPRKRLIDTNITLIDFGSAIFSDEYHSSVVSTRHYRAPEIILGLGWSFECDMWSIGCILIEFFTGQALFQTHDNLEHLKMMEIIIGGGWEGILSAMICHQGSSPMPDHSVKWREYAVDMYWPAGSTENANTVVQEFFQHGRVNWPLPETDKKARAFVRRLKTLEELVGPERHPVLAQFLDLLRRLLILDPRQRLRAFEALQHPFFFSDCGHL